ncbi:jg21290 [Pararge aegeria aegeria]|uniref:Jg21290 protein n=1 Tax=Pararge aegeria aegeria TaxID=348720 RepID=A0A8S4SG04_9NEOP|nr:jg21290 [Pararge aegeria aegeria]
MASFEDLSFDWSTLCQECPECWTASGELHNSPSMGMLSHKDIKSQRIISISTAVYSLSFKKSPVSSQLIMSLSPLT